MALGQRSEMSSEKLRQQFEGQLYKYTNVMKGWQFRWFLLDPEAGVLNYFLNETERKQRPRGSVHLAAAVISPSDEDSNTFTVNSATGEMFKLRAADARARHEWVSRIRAVAEMHTMVIAQSNPPLPPREHHSAGSLSHTAPSIAPGVQQGHRVQCSLAVLDAFSTVRDHLHRAEMSGNALSRAIEDLPGSGPCTTNIDIDMLLLKATTNTTLLCLSQCLSILQQQQIAPSVTPTGSNILMYPQGTRPCPSGSQLPRYVTSATPPSKKTSTTGLTPHVDDVDDKKSLQNEFSGTWSSPSTPNVILSSTESKSDSARLSSQDDLTDEEEGSECGSVSVEEHKSVILHLLSQLKLGMDLTRVVLPTFILERRSLLEMFADCMGHPHYFVRIPDETSPRTRMLAVLEWYLTSFHVGRKSSIAKKPYNPIIGETFHCSWRVPLVNGSPKLESFKLNNGGCAISDLVVSYTAEQVSHHPPVSAFYVECLEKQMCLNASIWTKSNFSGMSVGVNMIGDIILYLGSHGERYDFALPAAYARSIISVPWIELGGKVTISCVSTGYSANVIFHTKPFYGGKVNQVTAEVRNSMATVCRVQGEWNSHFEFTYPNGDTKGKVIYVEDLPVYKKRVRAMAEQGKFESRNLWRNVTVALRSGDISAATEYKKDLEDKQRAEERIRHENEISYPTNYFHKVDDTWIYNNLLVKP